MTQVKTITEQITELEREIVEAKRQQEYEMAFVLIEQLDKLQAIVDQPDNHVVYRLTQSSR